jgi:hypothetical protein
MKKETFLKCGDLVKIKKKYKQGYSKEIREEYGIVVERSRKRKIVKVLYSVRNHSIAFKHFLLDKIDIVKRKT